MSINESNEFDVLNQRVGERKYVAETESHSTEEYHRVKKAKATKKAIMRLVATALALVLAVLGITALEMIGWINDEFRSVLFGCAASFAMFKAGYLWHEIKN